jgi:hypothetical protein
MLVPGFMLLLQAPIMDFMAYTNQRIAEHLIHSYSMEMFPVITYWGGHQKVQTLPDKDGTI